MSFFENVLFVGLLAAVFFGLSAALSKVVLSEKFFGVEPKAAGLLLAFGVLGVLLAFFFSSPAKIPQNPLVIGAGIGVGILWAFGQILVLLAIQNKANISQLTPIYNINTLVAVFVGILFLGELSGSAQIIKVAIGAILITIGAILVSG